MERKPYPSDVSDAEWELLEPLVPAPSAHGRPSIHPRREIVNAIRYVLRTGCGWDYLPHDFPPAKTVYDYFRQWAQSGVWERANTVLRERARSDAGRESTPSAAIIDSQSVKTTKRGVKGVDNHKKIKGRKRHIVVDTQGNLLTVAVHSAAVQDYHGAREVLEKLAQQSWTRLKTIWADGIYKGDKQLKQWVKDRFGWSLEVVERDPTVKGFQVLPKRWVVERTFAWLGRNRRLSKEHDLCPKHSEAWVFAAMTCLLSRRLSLTT